MLAYCRPLRKISVDGSNGIRTGILKMVLNADTSVINVSKTMSRGERKHQGFNTLFNRKWKYDSVVHFLHCMSPIFIEEHADSYLVAEMNTFVRKMIYKYYTNGKWHNFET